MVSERRADIHGTSLLDVLVSRKRWEAIDICSFDLIPTSTCSLPQFEPGAHIDVHLQNGLVRQYSLSNSHEERDRYRIAVLRDPRSGGGSVAMHDEVHEGTQIRISPPKNFFALGTPTSHCLLLAGGIGITPLLCMATALTRSSANFALHYSCRSKTRAAFYEEIRASAIEQSTHFYFDDEGSALDLPKVLGESPANTQIFACGPNGFLNYVLTTAAAAGVPDEDVHREYFGGNAGAIAAGDAFQVIVASTGERIDVASDETVVTALSKRGIDIAVSCEQGVCGTCTTRVLDGVPDHRDYFLTARERANNNVFTPCCSRSKTKTLTLAL